MSYAYVNLIYNDNDNDFINILVSINSLINSKTKHDLILLYTLDVPQYKIDEGRELFYKFYYSDFASNYSNPIGIELGIYSSTLFFRKSPKN